MHSLVGTGAAVDGGVQNAGSNSSWLVNADFNYWVEVEFGVDGEMDDEKEDGRESWGP